MKKMVRPFISAVITTSFLLNPIGFSSYAADVDPLRSKGTTIGFITTEPVSTPQGQAHLEVTSVEIRSEQDLKVAQELIENAKASTPSSAEVTVYNVKLEDSEPTELSKKTQALVQEQMKGAATADAILPKQSFLKRHYNTTLALVRLVANTAVVYTGLVMGQGIRGDHALYVGLLAGAMSGAVQLKSEELYRWIERATFVTNKAKKMGILQSTEEGAELPKAEKLIIEAEKYTRWWVLEVGFLAACKGLMAWLNIPDGSDIWTTSFKSTATQGVYEVGVLRAATILGKIKPEWASRANVFKNVSYFAGSSLSVLAAVAVMAGLPIANMGFIVLGATGVVLNLVPRLATSEPVQKMLTRLRSHKSGDCGQLFQ